MDVDSLALGGGAAVVPEIGFGACAYRSAALYALIAYALVTRLLIMMLRAALALAMMYALVVFSSSNW
jgi:hypothetical protein